MKIETKNVEKIKISGAKDLDPINIVFEYIDERRGQVNFDCYGESWSIYFGGMPSAGVKDFFRTSPPDYLIDKASGLDPDVFDFDGLKSKLRKEICKARRACKTFKNISSNQFELGQREARIWFDEVSRMNSIDDFHRIPFVSWVLGEEWFLQDLPTKKNYKYFYLLQIIMVIQTALNILKQKEDEND